MEFKEVDQALEELESRIERLKALYEQYFMGIEKLEPLVPRKDVDRRIMILRREQVRNTAQRFKFNTLVQRYNSFQQYWARVGREIENGTYHRDVARAAARFGAKDALTIFGKKQAEKYQRLVANQEARKAKRKTTHVIDEEMIADDELLFVEDEETETSADDGDDESRPTPVIPAGRASVPPPPPPVIPPLPPPPRASSPGMAAVPPPLPPVVRASGQMPAPVVHLKADVTEEIDLRDAEILDVVADKPTSPGRKGVAPIRPETMIPMMMRRPTEQVPRVSEPPPPEQAQRSPSIPPDPEAGKKRVAALAAQVKQRTSSTMVPQANRPLDLELDLGGPNARGLGAAKATSSLDLDFDGDSKPQDKRPQKAEQKLDLDLGSPPRAREAAKPARALELDLGQGASMRQAPLPKIEAPAPTPEAKRPERVDDDGLVGRTPRIEPRPKLDTLPEIRELPVESTRTPPSARGEDEHANRARLAAAARERAASARETSDRGAGLSETRIRQIYGEYVDAKRQVRESTAGVTYDALAKQLRQQAEKLEASNPGRKVDYNVVMKNGKPTLKPILR